MKRLTFALLLTLSSVISTHADLPLVQNGHSPYVILLAPDASAADTRGARDIQLYLREMSGADVPILAENDGLPAHAIVVGRSKHLDELGVKLDPALGAEGFVIKTVGERVVIAGPGKRGTMYGCDTFLEKLGVRFFTPKVTRVPKQPNVNVPAIDETQTPAFEYREPFFTEAFEKDWAARLKTNGNHSKLDESTGGKIVYDHFVHTFDDLVPKELFATHPEYFPINGGKRVGGYTQRCLSNPEVLKLSIESVKRWIKDRPDALVYSVSQNDTGGACECEKCAEIVKQYGGVQSGIYIWFVNQVAEAIEKDHPDKLIDTLAYQFTEKAPTGIAPRANVRVRLCPIAVCQAHPYETDTAPQTKAFVATLAEWAKLSPTLYIWHYNTNFANYLAPFPDFEEFPADTRLYKKSGVKGIFFEGDYAKGGGGAEAELRSYVMAKLLWDEKSDSNALVSEWMAGVYGPAAKPMRAWFDLLHAKTKDPNAHLFIYSSPNDVVYFTDDVLTEGDKLFDEATKLAEPDPIAAEYVAKARLGLKYVKLIRHPSTGDDFKQFMSEVRKFGIGNINEGETTDAWEQKYLKANAPKTP